MPRGKSFVKDEDYHASWCNQVVRVKNTELKVFRNLNIKNKTKKRPVTLIKTGNPSCLAQETIIQTPTTLAYMALNTTETVLVDSGHSFLRVIEYGSVHYLVLI